MKINLKFSQFEEIQKKGYSLDLIFLLQLVNEGHNIDTLCSIHPKLVAFKQTLVRKGLLSEEHRITTDGKALLQFIEMEASENAEIIKKVAEPSLFDEWWKAYPGTDTFKYKDKSFEGARALRVRKDDCRKLFDKIVSQDDIKGEEMVEALKLDVIQKKEASVKTKTNRLTFMQNTYTYLYQRTFDSYVELIRQGTKAESSPEIVKDTDI